MFPAVREVQRASFLTGLALLALWGCSGGGGGSGGGGEPPLAPSGLTAQALSTTSVGLAWTDNSDDEADFRIERSEASAATGFAEVTTALANATSSTDGGLSPDTTYWYRVRATNAHGASAYSNVAVATTDTPVPAPPLAFTALSQGTSEIALSWTPGGVGPTAFLLERSALSTAAGFVQIASLPGTATAHLDTALAAGTQYWYRIRAVYPYGTSDYSAVATAITDDLVLPPDPSAVAPPVDPGVATDFHASIAFLFAGPDPIQTGVAPGVIDPDRAAVLRGSVLDRDGQPEPGATLAILGHPELGQTLSRADGRYDLVVNGGGTVTVTCTKPGRLPAQRRVDVPWRTFVTVPDVALAALDPIATVLDLGAPTPIQVARGSVVTDDSGTRQATLLVPAGTGASLVLPGGATIPVDRLTIRATEYTVGPRGPDTMPSFLPPASGYTYAVELSADEALAAGAVDVRFDRPLPFYVEDFVGFPVGSAVPVGYLDRERGTWVASQNGRVIRILSISGGLADLDADGDGQVDGPAALAALGVTDAERERLAALYPQPPSQLWRVPVAHFTPWDCNWPYGPPADAEPPEQPPPRKDPKDDEFTIECASLVEAQNQTLGEAVAIPGTPYALHYRSDRMPGRATDRALEIALTGSQVPVGVSGIQLVVQVAGQHHEWNYAPVPDLVHRFVWDGLDAYGRAIQGVTVAEVSIGYLYTAVYYPVPDDFEAAFARYPRNSVAPVRARTAVVLTQRYRATLRATARFAQAIAGWSLDVHHAVDRVGGLLLGHGGRRSAESLGNAMSAVATDAGYGDCWTTTEDGTPATETCLANPGGLVPAADGKGYYVIDTGQCVVRFVGADGLTSLEAGIEGYCTYLGDGTLAWETPLNLPMGGVATEDGGYIADTYNHRVRFVGADGRIRTVAGDGIEGFAGDGGLAAMARLAFPRALALAPDGSLYLADAGNHRVRRIGPDGIIETVAGNGTAAFCGDAGPGRDACLTEPSGLAVGPDGSVYVADSGNHRVRRIRPDGVIVTVAGNGAFGSEGDGGPATSAQLGGPRDVAVSRDGTIFVADTENHRIRTVRPDGIIRTAAGEGVEGFIGDGGLALLARFSRPEAVALAGDGALLVADTQNDRIRRVSSAIGDTVAGGEAASADGSERYLFAADGRHLRTLRSATGSLRHEFSYDADGRLVAVSDADGNVTRVERDAAGAPTAIVAPDGHRTALEVDADGHLARITLPGGETTDFGYAEGGLLASMTDAAGRVRSFTYDAGGRLVRDEGPSGDFLALSRTTLPDGFEVATSTGLGPLARFTVARSAGGGSVRTDASVDGRIQTMTVATDGTRTVTEPDGTTVTVSYGPDPRYGVQAPVVREQVIRTPAGLMNVYGRELTVTPGPPGDPVGYLALHSVRSINGRQYVLDDDTVQRRAVATSPTGRSVTVDYDDHGRIVRLQRGDLAPMSYAYDARGRITGITRGDGLDARSWSLGYGADGYLERVTYPDGAAVSYVHDSAGRVVSQVFPDGRTATFGRDALGRIASYAPPGRPAQAMSYGPDGLLLSYALPDAGQGVDAIGVERGGDGLVARRVLPDGTAIAFDYDAARRLVSKTAGPDQIAIGYDPASGLLAQVTRSGVGTLSFAYDGFLRTRTEWQGTVAAGVTLSFDDDLRKTSETVDGTPAVLLGYDPDGLLTRAGDLTIARSSANGLPIATTLGDLVDSWTYDAFGEPVQRSVLFQGGEIYSATWGWDALGRVTGWTESVLGGPAQVVAFGFDAAGRLAQVSRDSVVVASYVYDENGNRVVASDPSGSVAATYDARDRLLAYGAATFLWNRNGQPIGRTDGGSATTYAFDAFGALAGVSLPGGPFVEYVVDGVGLRIGKRVDGVLVQGFVHDGGRRVIAELDGAGNVVSRFVYGAGRGAPDSMSRGGRTYRIVSDLVGSPRLVVDVADGTIAQRLEYGPFGEVTLDTQPGFQPFGFAGGLLDVHTGLTHFDARDYDSATGRFLTPDPLLAASGGANAYVYAFGDPVNWVDRSGRVNESRNGPPDFMDEVPPGKVERVEDPDTGDFQEVGRTEDGIDFDRSCFAGTCTETIWDESTQTSGQVQYSTDCEGAGCGDMRERNARAQEGMEAIDPGHPGPAPPPAPPGPPSPGGNPPNPGQPGGSSPGTPGAGSPGAGSPGGGVCKQNIWRDSNGNIIAVIAVPP